MSGRWRRYAGGIVEAGVLVALVATAGWRVASDRVGSRDPVGPSPASLPDTIRRADAEYDAGHLAAASAIYADVLRKDTDNVDARIRLANVFRLNSWNASALTMVDEALGRDPTNSTARLLRSRIYRDEGEGALAVAEYEAALATRPTNTEALYYVGTSYQAARRFDDAIRAYQRAIAADVDLIIPPFEPVPFGVQARTQLARTYRQLSRVQLQAGGYADGMSLLDLALDVLRDAHVVVTDASLRSDGGARAELVGALVAKGSLLRQARQPEAAVLAVYEEITRIDPTDIGAWIETGIMLRRAAMSRLDLEAVERVFLTAYEIDPRDPDAHTNLTSVRQDLAYSDAELDEMFRAAP
ncbi:MAG: tetratricopeptide repeat protein [Candidatus Poribacteria bacterium]